MKITLSALLVVTDLLSGRSARAAPKYEEPELGTFQNPSSLSRPRFRYWVPDASVNLSRVQNDIADAGSVGAGQLDPLICHSIAHANFPNATGGVELLGYYNYGDIESGAGVIPVDWTVYGWGTPAWSEP